MNCDLKSVVLVQPSMKDPFNFKMNEITENILRLPVKTMNINLNPNHLDQNKQNESHNNKNAKLDLESNDELSPLNNLAELEENALIKDEEICIEQIMSNPKLDRLLEIEAEDVSAWTSAHKSEFISVYKKQVDGNPVILIKAYSSMPGIPPEKAFRLIHDLKLRAQWDDVLSNMKEFDKIDENVDYMYSLFKAPFGVSNRDFVQKRTKGYNYKGCDFLLHLESVDHAE